MAGANQVDHIVALANGGSDDLENLTLACRPCNLRKRALRLPPLWGAIAAARAAEAASSIRHRAAQLGKKPTQKSEKRGHIGPMFLRKLERLYGKDFADAVARGDDEAANRHFNDTAYWK
jgi:hypothetical protein